MQMKSAELENARRRSTSTSSNWWCFLANPLINYSLSFNNNCMVGMSHNHFSMGYDPVESVEQKKNLARSPEKKAEMV